MQGSLSGQQDIIQVLHMAMMIIFVMILMMVMMIAMVAWIIVVAIVMTSAYILTIFQNIQCDEFI